MEHITSEPTVDFDEYPSLPCPSDCPICLEPFEDIDATRVPVKLPCGHFFHTVCLAFLFVPVGSSENNQDFKNGRCPLCRTKLFHLKYIFYTEEMMKEREQNLLKELQVLQRSPTITQEEVQEEIIHPTREVTPEEEELFIVRQRNPRRRTTQRRSRPHLVQNQEYPL